MDRVVFGAFVFQAHVNDLPFFHYQSRTIRKSPAVHCVDQLNSAETETRLAAQDHRIVGIEASVWCQCTANRHAARSQVKDRKIVQIVRYRNISVTDARDLPNERI